MISGIEKRNLRRILSVIWNQNISNYYGWPIRFDLYLIIKEDDRGSDIKEDSTVWYFLFNLDRIIYFFAENLDI